MTVEDKGTLPVPGRDAGGARQAQNEPLTKHPPTTGDKRTVTRSLVF